MSDDLNAGKGRCRGTARLTITPVPAVIELGASRDVLTKVLNAVHHANRHGLIDDFIAVALPDMTMGRECMLPGHRIELFGSRVSLSGFLELDGAISLTRRGMIQTPEVQPFDITPGVDGIAYTRDRTSEKRTEGWHRRNRARAARRGITLGEPAKPRENDGGTLTLNYGRAVLDIRAVPGAVPEGSLLVSTYGFSGKDAPAVLPATGATEQVRDAA